MGSESRIVEVSYSMLIKGNSKDVVDELTQRLKEKAEFATPEGGGLSFGEDKASFDRLTLNIRVGEGTSNEPK